MGRSPGKKENLELKKTVKIKKNWPRYFLLGLKTKTGSKKGKRWTQKLVLLRRNIRSQSFYEHNLFKSGVYKPSQVFMCTAFFK